MAIIFYTSGTQVIQVISTLTARHDFNRYSGYSNKFLPVLKSKRDVFPHFRLTLYKSVFCSEYFLLVIFWSIEWKANQAHSQNQFSVHSQIRKIIQNNHPQTKYLLLVYKRAAQKLNLSGLNLKSNLPITFCIPGIYDIRESSRKFG